MRGCATATASSDEDGLTVLRKTFRRCYFVVMVEVIDPTTLVAILN